MLKISNAETLETVLIALEAVKKGPTNAELANAPLLEFWSPVLIDEVPRLVGIAIGHPTLPRAEVSTSILLFLSADRTYARTLSRWYRLGPKDDSGRARFDRLSMKRFNLKRLPAYRGMLGREAQIAALRLGDRVSLERAVAVGRRLSHRRE